MRTGVGSGGNPEHHLWPGNEHLHANPDCCPQLRAAVRYEERERCLRLALEHARNDEWS